MSHIESWLHMVSITTNSFTIMKHKIKFSWLFIAIAATFMLTACEQEEIDNTNEITDPVVPVVTEEEDDCSGVLTFMGDAFALNETASARIFKPTCDVALWPDSTQMVVTICDDAFNWGPNGPVPGFSTINGLPGIEFQVYDGQVVVEDGYWAVGNMGQNNLISFPANGMINTYSTPWITVDITEAGNVVGENIAGTVYTYQLVGDVYEVQYTGTFCVPIVEVCE